MKPLSRRRLLTGVASATTSGLLTGCGSEKTQRPGIACRETRRPLETVTLDCDDPAFAALVNEIVDTPRDRIFDAMAARLRSGLDPATLLAADYHAAVRSVTPSANAVMHSLLVVNSVRLAGAATDDRLRLASVLWAIDNFKGEQPNRQVPLPPVDEARVPSSESAARELLIAGLEAHEPDDADAGATGMARLGDRTTLVDLFLHYSTRNGTDPHWQIAPTQCFRSLDAFGWSCAEPTFRFVARMLAESAAVGDTSTFEASVALARTGLDLDGPSRDLSRVLDLLAQSRTDTADGLRDAAAAALAAGLAPDALWDGLLAASAEIILRGNGGGGLHRFDGTNAMRWAMSRASTPELRALLLLQAAAFVPPTRVEGAAWNRPPPFREVNIDSFGPGAAPAELETLFERGGTGRGSVNDVSPAENALAWLAEGGSVCSYLARARELVVRKGQGDAHFVKFPVAVFEEIERVDAYWVPRLLATEVLVNPSPGGHDDWSRFDEAMALADELGV